MKIDWEKYQRLKDRGMEGEHAILLSSSWEQGSDDCKFLTKEKFNRLLDKTGDIELAIYILMRENPNACLSSINISEETVNTIMNERREEIESRLFVDDNNVDDSDDVDDVEEEISNVMNNDDKEIEDVTDE